MLVQTWQRVNRQMTTSTVGYGTAQESTVGEKSLRPIRNSTEVERRILFSRKTETITKGRIEVLGIIHMVTQDLAIKKVSLYVQLQWLKFNGKDNLSRLWRITAIRSIQLPTLRETIMIAVRWIDNYIMAITGDQKRY